MLIKPHRALRKTLTGEDNQCLISSEMFWIMATLPFIYSVLFNFLIFPYSLGWDDASDRTFLNKWPFSIVVSEAACIFPLGCQS